MTITLDFAEAKELLDRAVREKGADYVYTPDGKLPWSSDPEDGNVCQYFDPEDGEPGCIVGHVLFYKGVTFESIADLNIGNGVMSLRDRGFLDADHKTVTLLMVAQNRQDDGMPWGEAVKRALWASGE